MFVAVSTSIHIIRPPDSFLQDRSDMKNGDPDVQIAISVILGDSRLFHIQGKHRPYPDGRDSRDSDRTDIDQFEIALTNPTKKIQSPPIPIIKGNMGTPEENGDPEQITVESTIQAKFTDGGIHWLGQYACCEGGHPRNYRCPHGYRRMRASQLLRAVGTIRNDEFGTRLHSETEQQYREIAGIQQGTQLPEGFISSKNIQSGTILDRELGRRDEAVWKLGYFVTSEHKSSRTVAPSGNPVVFFI